MTGRPAFQYAVSAAVIAGAILLWELGVANGYLKAYQFPPASKIATGFYEIATSGFPTGITIWSHILTTVTRILQGYLAAIALAIPAGLFIGAFPVVNKMLEPVIVFCRSVATLSLSDQIAGLLLRKDHQVELEKDQEG